MSCEAHMKKKKHTHVGFVDKFYVACCMKYFMDEKSELGFNRGLRVSDLDNLFHYMN